MDMNISINESLKLMPSSIVTSKMNIATVFVFLGLLYCAHGECPTTCADQADQPVCGTDGVTFQTYSNMCQLKMAICKYYAAGKKYKYVHDGACRDAASLTNVKPDTHLATTADKCSSLTCQSTETYLICGSDGVTYQNKCEFAQAECKYSANGRTLTAVSIGACQTNVQTADRCDMNCDSTSYPICGTDGNTYQNKCFFYQAKCKYDANSQKFDVAHLGACKTSSSLTGAVLTSGTMPKACSSLDRCDSTPQRICGSDGNRYGSECEFMKALCRNPRLTRVDCASVLTAALG